MIVVILVLMSSQRYEIVVAIKAVEQMTVAESGLHGRSHT
jgi:hypothetical protein